MGYDALVINAHPDDAETQMGGTLAKLSDLGQRIAIVDLTDGEPSDFPEPGQLGERAAEAARILGVERIRLGGQDRLLSDTPVLRLELARLIREHQPRWVYGIDDACVHPDHAAAAGLTRAAVFLAGLEKWERVPGGERLGEQEPWKVDRLFFPHCKMEPPWAEFAFAVDVSSVYARKRQALALYQPTEASAAGPLPPLWEAEDQYYGRLVGVEYAEIFRSAAPLVVDSPTVFRPVVQG